MYNWKYEFEAYEEIRDGILDFLAANERGLLDLGRNGNNIRNWLYEAEELVTKAYEEMKKEGYI